MNGALLSVRDLAVAIGRSRPVDGVSFDIAAGETFALLGESGCGKSMTALALMRLLPPVAAIKAGTVRFDGRDTFSLAETAMRDVRGAGMAMIFQEPATSLNPVMTVGRQIAEVLALHGGGQDRVVELLEAVGIPDPARRATEFPFQLSGGMKQRAMIAMALAGSPKLLIADEPTTALDVTIQAQVLDLLKDLQRRQGMAMLLITHDLGVVARMADRVGVMYAGQLVEVARREDFFAAPAIRIPGACSRPCRMPRGGPGGWPPFPAACRRWIPISSAAASPIVAARRCRCVASRRHPGGTWAANSSCAVIWRPPRRRWCCRKVPGRQGGARRRRCWRSTISRCIFRSGAACCSAPPGRSRRWMAFR